MRLIEEFREFALKGSVLDLAVGVVIGAAFGKIVDSFVKDILMPPLGILMGGGDLSKHALVLADGVTLNYGKFLGTVIDFVIIAFAIFLVVKRINAWRRKPEAAAPSMKDCPECLSSIPMAARRCKFCASTT